MCPLSHWNRHRMNRGECGWRRGAQASPRQWVTGWMLREWRVASKATLCVHLLSPVQANCGPLPGTGLSEGRRRRLMGGRQAGGVGAPPRAPEPSRLLGLGTPGASGQEDPASQCYLTGGCPVGSVTMDPSCPEVLPETRRYPIFMTRKIARSCESGTGWPRDPRLRPPKSPW